VTIVAPVTGDHARPSNVDGRRARRERNRSAIVDAVFAAILDGKVPPTADDVAARAGVSVSSVFRNFDGLDDLQREAFDRFQEQYLQLFDATPEAPADRSTRIEHYVRMRIELYRSAGPLMHLARQRALDYQPMADGVARMRSRLADQTHRHFRIETSALSSGRAADLIALVDSTTSPEAFEVMSASHARSSRQITRAWVGALGILLDGFRTQPMEARP
jgi:TetR/AcrR family transcriptional regulator, regulator of autoinduction and epiphytic fitness